MDSPNTFTLKSLITSAIILKKRKMYLFIITTSIGESSNEVIKTKYFHVILQMNQKAERVDI